MAKQALYAALALAFVGSQIAFRPPFVPAVRPKYPKLKEPPYLVELREKWEKQRDQISKEIQDGTRELRLDEAENNPNFKAYMNEKARLEATDATFVQQLLDYQTIWHKFETDREGPKSAPPTVGYGALGAAAVVVLVSLAGYGRFAAFVGSVSVAAVLALTLPTKLSKNIFDFSDVGCVNMFLAYTSVPVAFWFSLFGEDASAAAKAKAKAE